MKHSPFVWFRKHAKVIFAIVTIICMFTFVLAGGFGGGDAFQWFLTKIGASNKRGKVVTKLYGDKVYEDEIRIQVGKRQMANEFLKRAISEGLANLFKEVQTAFARPRPTDATQRVQIRFREYVDRTLYEVVQSQQGQFNPELFKLLSERDFTSPLWVEVQKEKTRRQTMSLGEVRRLLLDRQQDMAVIRARLEEKGLDDEANLMGALMTQNGIQLWTIGVVSADREPANALWLGGSTKRQDMLDFLMWLHQADALGIKLVDSDVRAMVNRLSPLKPLLTGDTSTDSQAVASAFRREGRETIAADLKQVYAALNDEMRVALAQGIILGEEPGILAYRGGAFRDPLSVTPQEYLDYYRQQRQTANFVLLSVPVDPFFSDNLPRPTEKQIKELYTLFKTDDPRPDRLRPGFRVPPKARVQWVGLEKVSKVTYQKVADALPLAGFVRDLEDPRQDHYETRADERLAGLIALSVGAATSREPGSLAGIIQAAGHLEETYEFYTGRKESDPFSRSSEPYQNPSDSFRVPSLLQGDPALAYYTAMNLRTAITSTIGHAAPGDANLSAFFGPIIASQASPILQLRERYPKLLEEQDALIKQDRTRRARVVAGLVGSSATPALMSPPPWICADSIHERKFDFDNKKLILDSPPIDTHVPIAAIRFQVLQATEERLARQIEREDIGEMTRKLTETKGDVEKAQKILADYSKRMKLNFVMGESAYDDDRYTIEKDPGLRPLNNAFKRQRDRAGSERVNPNDSLAVRIFGISDPLYDPQPVDFFGNSNFYFWKTKFEPQSVPDLKSIRDKVVRAWQYREARKLAQKEAERIRDEVNRAKNEKEAMKVLEGVLAKQPTWDNLIRLNNVARMEQVKSLRAEVYGYKPFEIKEDEIEYPASGFVDDLMKLDQGEAGVLTDRPEKHYYVAYAIKKAPIPSAEEALEERNRVNLWALLDEDTRRERQQEIIRDLRRQAADKGKLDAYDRFVLEPDISDEGER